MRTLQDCVPKLLWSPWPLLSALTQALLPFSLALPLSVWTSPPAVWIPSCPWVRPVGTESVVVWVQGSPPSLLHMCTEEWEVLRGAGGQDTLPAAYLGCFPDHSP